MATNANTPVVWLEDGPRLVLADGSVVRPLVTDVDTENELLFVAGDRGSGLFGEAVDEAEVGIAFVDDPEAEDHEVVQEVLDAHDA